jgi:hypothetical protein
MRDSISDPFINFHTRRASDALSKNLWVENEVTIKMNSKILKSIFSLLKIFGV